MLRRSQATMKSIFRHNFIDYQFNKAKNELILLSANQQKKPPCFSLNSITKSEILLNDKVVLSVDHHRKAASEYQHIKHLKRVFKHELQYKMLADRVRKVQLTLMVTNNKTHSVCLYLRQGDQRHTKKPFNQVIDDVIDWYQSVPESMLGADTKLNTPDITAPKSNEIGRK